MSWATGNPHGTTLCVKTIKVIIPSPGYSIVMRRQSAPGCDFAFFSSVCVHTERFRGYSSSGEWHLLWWQVSAGGQSMAELPGITVSVQHCSNNGFALKLRTGNQLWLLLPEDITLKWGQCHEPTLCLLCSMTGLLHLLPPVCWIYRGLPFCVCVKSWLKGFISVVSVADCKKQHSLALKDFLQLVCSFLINSQKNSTPSHLTEMGGKSHTLHEISRLLSMLTARGGRFSTLCVWRWHAEFLQDQVIKCTEPPW